MHAEVQGETTMLCFHKVLLGGSLVYIIVIDFVVLIVMLITCLFLYENIWF